MVVVVVVVAGQSFAAKTLLFVFWHGALRGGRTTQPTSAWIESLLLLVLLMMVMVVLAREFPPKRARWKRLVGTHISVFLCLALLPWWWRWPPRSRRTLLLLLAVERIFSYDVSWLGGRASNGAG